MKIELGNVYRHVQTGRIYLAVTTELLIEVRNGRVREVQPAHRVWQVQRGYSVDQICVAWNVTSEFMDEVVSRYIQPVRERDDQTRHKQKRRSQKRGNADEELEQRKLQLRHRFRPG